jgi:hypothetical protein
MNSIEWLQQELMKSIYFQRLINDLESKKTQIELNVFEQAKQMRDQEIRDACGMALSKLLYQQSIQKEITEDTSDGYHTFKELYEFRKAYNVALFNEWSRLYADYDVHKSWKHNDGELCFGGGWFIVVAILPSGQISNHYKAEDWDLFKIPEVEKAKYSFDGHTGQDVINRLLTT